MAFFVAACGLLGNANRVTLPAAGEIGRPLPVELTKRTPTVVGLELPNAAQLAVVSGHEGAKTIPERPTAILVAWQGGACDERAELSVGADPTGTIIIAIRNWAPDGPCEAIGIQRAVVVNVASPIDTPIGMSVQPCIIGRPDCQ